MSYPGKIARPLVETQDFRYGPRMSLIVSRILHAGYVFECESVAIAFDPIFENPFSRNCHAFPAVEFDEKQIRNLKLDAVFISHFHDDHCSMESLNLLDRDTPIYLFCLFDELFAMIRELGFQNVHSLKLDQAIDVGPIKITPRRALDADVDCLFQIQASGLNILNVVDSWIDDDTLNLLINEGPWDLVLWPFQTMREIEVIAPSRATPAPAELPSEWREQLQMLKPKFIVPSSCQFQMESWSWYNQVFFPVSYRQFHTEIETLLPESKVVRMNPSTSFQLDSSSFKPAGCLNWVVPVGEQNVDYDYRPSSKPPTTAEITKHFPQLTAQQFNAVHEFCQSGILEKYKSLEAPHDPYFESERLWRLSLYDHDGSSTEYYYLINGGNLKPVTKPTSLAIAWTTEVPISKVYAALAEGESLTSMYVRINDHVFAAEIENQIADADVVEDPLIRCLFSQAFGSYQRAQLDRILKKQTAWPAEESISI